MALRVISAPFSFVASKLGLNCRSCRNKRRGSNGGGGADEVFEELRSHVCNDRCPANCDQWIYCLDDGDDHTGGDLSHEFDDVDIDELVGFADDDDNDDYDGRSSQSKPGLLHRFSSLFSWSPLSSAASNTKESSQSSDKYQHGRKETQSRHTRTIEKDGIHTEVDTTIRRSVTSRRVKPGSSTASPPSSPSASSLTTSASATGSTRRRRPRHRHARNESVDSIDSSALSSGAPEPVAAPAPDHDDGRDNNDNNDEELGGQTGDGGGSGNSHYDEDRDAHAFEEDHREFDSDDDSEEDEDDGSQSRTSGDGGESGSPSADHRYALRKHLRRQWTHTNILGAQEPRIHRKPSPYKV